MRNIDIETLYKRINKSVVLVGAVFEDKTWTKIVKSCRLKPYSVFLKYFDYKTRLENHWVDEYGNSLYIENSKNYLIVMNDVKLLNMKILSSDLFYGRSLKENYRNSKKMIYISGNILGESIDVVSFLGRDEYLRSYYIFDGAAHKASPFLLGVETLKQIFGSDNSKMDCCLLTNIENGYIIDLPTKTDLKQILGERLMKVINDE